MDSIFRKKLLFAETDDVLAFFVDQKSVCNFLSEDWILTLCSLFPTLNHVSG
jgi:hypothetical protein